MYNAYNAKAYSAASKTSPLAYDTIPRRNPTDRDVQIEILFCGICHSFSDKVALVTGAASGIGLTTAKAFAGAGAAVTVADVHEDAVRSAVEELVASVEEFDRVNAINLRGVSTA